MAYFVGLDVSLKMTSICIVEADGTPIWQGKVPSEPAALMAALSPIATALRSSASRRVRCPNGYTERWARVASQPFALKHASDAHGIAEMMRLGHFRPVHVKSKASQMLRTILGARQKFVDQMIAIELTIRGLLKIHGLKVGALNRCAFAARIECLLADAPELRIAIGPLLEARNMMRKQMVLLDRQMSRLARKD